MKHGADITARTDGGLTPLHSITAYGSGDAVEKLVQLGAEIDSRDHSDSNALYWASKKWKYGNSNKIA